MSESKTGGVGETKAQPEPEGVTRSVSIGRSNSMAAEAEANKSLCAPLYQCYEAFTKTRAGSALSREYSFFFNFVFAHLLWWAVAFPTLIDEGYENDISNGGAPHGSDGSGIVPVALFLVIVASFLFVLRFVRNLIEGVPLTAAELITQQITRQNTDNALHEKERATVVP